MIPALLAGLASALWLALFAWATVDGLWRPDAFDYAQIGRELAQGHGFASRHAIYALHLEFLKTHALLDADWPNLHRFPLPSLVMALGFLVFGPIDAVVVGSGIVFHAATTALVFAWARRAVGLAAAVACAVLLNVNGTLMEMACSGLSEPPVLFFFTLALYAVWRWGREPRATGWLAPAAAGVALGLAGLARTNALFAAPWLALAMWRADAAAPGASLRRLAAAALAFAGGVVLVSLPWWGRNWIVAGDPFFSLHSYFLLPSGTDQAFDKWDLSVPWVRELTSPLAVLREDPAGVLAKWQANGWRWLASLPGLAGLLGVVPLACAAPFLCIDPRLRRVAGVVLVCFAWNALWVGFTDFFLLKYHLPFVPGLVLSAVAVVWRIGERLRERWPATPALQGFACAIAVVAMADWSGAREAFDLVPASLARYDRPHWAEIQRRTGPDAVVVSDQSHAVAWETGRRSVRLHYDRDAEGQLVLGVLSLNDDYLPVDAVYLSRQFLRDPGKRAVLRRTLAELPRFRREFQEVETFPGGGFLFLRRPTPRSPARAAAPASPDRPADPDPR